MQQPIESKTKKGRPKARTGALVRQPVEVQQEANGIESNDATALAIVPPARDQASTPAPNKAAAIPKKRGRILIS